MEPQGGNKKPGSAGNATRQGLRFTLGRCLTDQMFRSVRHRPGGEAEHYFALPSPRLPVGIKKNRDLRRTLRHCVCIIINSISVLLLSH